LTNAGPYCIYTAKKVKAFTVTTKTDQRRQRSLDRLQEQYRARAAELADTGYVLQGSLTQRWMTCGKASCRCIDDPDARHGPYHVWTFKRDAKTVCIYLSPEQATVCADWINNNRRLDRLVRQMRSISRRAAKLNNIPAK